MKIRLLIDAKMPGGMETHIINLCAGLIARHHECKIIFVTDYANSPLYTLCNQHQVPYTACKNKWSLFQTLQRDPPDIIHTHGYKANILGRLYGLFTRTKIVTTHHSGEQPTGRLILYTFFDRWSSFLSHNIAVNALIAKSLPTRTTVIPNFVEMPQSLNTLRKIKPYHIYFIGRFNTEKDPLLFCKLSTLKNKDFEWHMVGDGPLLADCKKQYQSTVHFHGLRTDMKPIWPDVDMLCITSRYEGLPLVLIEAMSRGIPVVAFNVGSINDIITDKDYCIDHYNIQTMEACILAHFSKPITLRQAMSQAARNTTHSFFSSEVIIPKIENLYLGCLKND